MNFYLILYTRCLFFKIKIEKIFDVSFFYPFFFWNLILRHEKYVACAASISFNVYGLNIDSARIRKFEISADNFTPLWPWRLSCRDSNKNLDIRQTILIGPPCFFYSQERQKEIKKIQKNRNEVVSVCSSLSCDFDKCF